MSEYKLKPGDKTDEELKAWADALNAETDPVKVIATWRAEILISPRNFVRSFDMVKEHILAAVASPAYREWAEKEKK